MQYQDPVDATEITISTPLYKQLHVKYQQQEFLLSITVEETIHPTQRAS